MVEKFEMFADIPKGQHLVAEIYALWKKKCNVFFVIFLSLSPDEVWSFCRNVKILNIKIFIYFC